MGLFDNADDRFDPSTTDFILYSELVVAEDAEILDEEDEFDEFDDEFDDDF